jgi:broad specificity phosphatase PhoE
MPRVWLVRHGEPTEAIGADPGLTARGHAQAAALVDVLAPAALVTSPLARARQTASPLERAWSTRALVDDSMRELPSPTDGTASRREWLLAALRGTFADMGEPQQEWRRAIFERLGSFETDTVVTTHAVVINAIVGASVGDDRVLNFRPAHTSVTIVDVGPGGELTLIERGREADIVVS